MNLRKQLLTKNRCYQSGRRIVPKGVMCHSTGANNPRVSRYVQPDDGFLGLNKNRNDWNNPDVDVCVSAFIGLLKDGSIGTYQTLEWDMRGWHSGKGRNGSANNTHIGFEICEDGLDDAIYFNKVYKEAVELTAYLCEMYNLDPLKDGVVICHKEGNQRGIASGHADVLHWLPRFGKNMDTFRSDVDKLLKGGVKVDVKTAKQIVKAKAGLDDKTLQYLCDDYRYGDALIVKLAEAMK